MNPSAVSSQQIAAVKSSWAEMTPIADQAAALFYHRLFELDPTLKLVLVSDMEQQGRRLLGMIGIAVNSLDRIDDIVPVVQALGRRHIDYGVKYHDYDTVAAALLWTMTQCLGEAFTTEVEASWIAVYNLFADIMKDATLSVYSSYRYG
jgi:hemoglobin-like flavoprotein